MNTPDKKLKIGIIGYGKMGKAVEKMAMQRGHHIAWIVDDAQTMAGTIKKPHEADVAIEFTQPKFAPRNIVGCMYASLPVVSGTTGWNDRWQEVKKKCKELNGSLLHSANFSPGMNIFFHINKMLAEKLNKFDEYKPSIKEKHHIHKKDHPSGTAISLAEQIIIKNHSISKWKETEEPTENNTLPIQSIRQEEIPGIHEIKWNAPFDEIKLVHTAKNREGFALGAILAAEYIVDKKGIFTMSDVLNL